jgi:hypothetical protein
MAVLLTLAQLRETVQSSIDELAAWFVAKPRVFALARPAQQLQFELACRLRDRIRERTENPRWDRLHFDASDGPWASPAIPSAKPPILVDARQLFGAIAADKRTATEPDVALAVHVLRAPPNSLDYDENGLPLRQAFAPDDLFRESVILEQRVGQFERLSHLNCDGALLVVYSNDARRRTAVDAREIASWASWQTPIDNVWWTARYFRAKAR